MGKISSEPKTGNTTNHFSHEHPLTLTNHQPHQTLNTFTCAGCKHKPHGPIYSCTTCDYFLHKDCFEMPDKITHPCHKNHQFSLLTKPAYPNGSFRCDACGETGSGFSYHCCGLDLHILCALMPLSVRHPFHAHKLDLTYESPYGVLDFSCDICKNNGSNHWLYRCTSCGFDAHLNCARGVNQPPVQQQSPASYMDFLAPAATTSRSASQSPAQGYQSQSYFAGANHYPMQQNTSPHPMMGTITATGFPAASPYMPQYGLNRNEVAFQEFQRTMSQNRAIRQAMVQNMLANRARGNSGLAQYMHLMSGLNNSGFGGGGGGIPGVDPFGGGGMDPTSLLGGGGIPGVDPFGGGGMDPTSLVGGGGIPGVDAFGGGGMDPTSLLGGGGGVASLLSGLLGGFSF